MDKKNKPFFIIKSIPYKDNNKNDIRGTHIIVELTKHGKEKLFDTGTGPEYDNKESNPQK